MEEGNGEKPLTGTGFLLGVIKKDLELDSDDGWITL